MARAAPAPGGLRLPAGPLLAAVEQAARGRETTLVGLLGRAGQKAYDRARRAGRLSLRQAEDLCDLLGCHPFELYGLVYQRLALAAVPGPLEPDATVTAWHETVCARPGCGRPIRPGERVGLVGEVGACCAVCCGLTDGKASAA
jgi:hypothetical protein